MKNTFAVTMTLLLALTLGGSYAGYRIATTPHHEEAVGAAGKPVEGGDPTTGKVLSEEVPSAREAATGAAGAGGALGDVMQDQAGGTQSGENGAVAAPGSESNTGTQTGEAQEGDAPDAGAEEAGEADNGTAAQGEGPVSPATAGTEAAGAGGSTGENEESQNAEDGVGEEGTGQDATEEGAAEETAPENGASDDTSSRPQENTTAAAQTTEVAVSAAASQGQPIFASTCGGCHGANAQGVIGPNLLTQDGPRGWTLAQFTTSLREGRTPERELGAVMPRYGAEPLSDQDIAHIHAYLKTLG